MYIDDLLVSIKRRLRVTFVDEYHQDIWELL